MQEDGVCLEVKTGVLILVRGSFAHKSNSSKCLHVPDTTGMLWDKKDTNYGSQAHPSLRHSTLERNPQQMSCASRLLPQRPLHNCSLNSGHSSAPLGNSMTPQEAMRLITSGTTARTKRSHCPTEPNPRQEAHIPDLVKTTFSSEGCQRQVAGEIWTERH